MNADTRIHAGVVLWYDLGRGYGFVADHFTDDLIFLTHTSLEQIGLKYVNSGSRILFDVDQGKASCKVRSIRVLTPSNTGLLHNNTRG